MRKINQDSQKLCRAGRSDKVQIHYTGTLADGTVFDSNKGKDPLEFVIGEGKLIPGFENAVIGLSEGESVRVSIPSYRAYGQHRKELVWAIQKKDISEKTELKVGQIIKLKKGEKEESKVGPNHITAFVVGINDEHVILDANHPLAGKDLIFEIELIKIL